MENKIQHIPVSEGKERVVIVGGGFGGLCLARKLNSDHYQTVLIDRFNYHQFQPLFYQVATCGVEPSSISFPFRKIFQHRKEFHFRMCSALSIDPDRNTLHTDAGDIEYDHLVLAMGCDTNFFGKDTLKAQTLTLKSTAEALYIRNQILQNLEVVMNGCSENDLAAYLTFVIVGAGATGIEMAGALAEMKKYILPKDYPELDFEKMKIYIVDRGDRPLHVFSHQSSKEVTAKLQSLGVELILNVGIDDYQDDNVILSDGRQIRSKNLFWVGGIIGNRIEGLHPDSWGAGGRLKVDCFGQTIFYPNIYAIGDIALMADEEYPHGHPQVAQVAIQMGRHLCKIFEQKRKGKPLEPFSYRNLGSMATIGRNSAVAELWNLKLKGLSAWMIWCFVHLMAIVGVKNRLFIFIDWLWSYITYDQSLRILVRPLFRNRDIK